MSEPIQVGEEIVTSFTARSELGYEVGSRLSIKLGNGPPRHYWVTKISPDASAEIRYYVAVDRAVHRA